MIKLIRSNVHTFRKWTLTQLLYCSFVKYCIKCHCYALYAIVKLVAWESAILIICTQSINSHKPRVSSVELWHASQNHVEFRSETIIIHSHFMCSFFGDDNYWSLLCLFQIPQYCGSVEVETDTENSSTRWEWIGGWSCKVCGHSLEGPMCRMLIVCFSVLNVLVLVHEEVACVQWIPPCSLCIWFYLFFSSFKCEMVSELCRPLPLQQSIVAQWRFVKSQTRIQFIYLFMTLSTKNYGSHCGCC